MNDAKGFSEDGFSQHDHDERILTKRVVGVVFFYYCCVQTLVIVPQSFDSCLAPQSRDFTSHAGVFNAPECGHKC